MKCPFCSKDDNDVVRTLDRGEFIKRYRRCNACQLSFSTDEVKLTQSDNAKCRRCGCGRFQVIHTMASGKKVFKTCLCQACGAEFKVTIKSDEPIEQEMSNECLTMSNGEHRQASTNDENPFL